MRIALVLGLCACGRVGFSALPTGDGGGDGSSSGDAVDAPMLTGDGPVVPPSACGATVLLSDGFDSGITSGVWIVNNSTGITASELNSNEEIDFGTNVGGGRYAYFRSANSFAADGICAAAEVAGTPNLGDANAAIYVKLFTSAQQVEFFEHGGALDLRTQSNQTVTTLATVTWDPVADRFLRLRHLAGTTYWDTSPDGTNYEQRYSAAGFPTTNCQVELGAGAIATVSNGGTALFASSLTLGP